MRYATPCFFLSIVMGVLSAHAQADKPPSLDEIKAQWAHSRGKVESLFVEFQHEATTPLEPKVLVSLSKFSRQLFLTKEEVRWAFKGDERYIRTKQPPTAQRLLPRSRPEPHPGANEREQAIVKEIQEQYDRAEEHIARAQRMSGSKKNPEKRDPNVIELDVESVRGYNGRMQWSRTVRQQGARAQAMVHTPDRSMHWFQPNRYMRNVGWGLTDPTEADENIRKLQATGLLPDVFELADYDIAPQTESIDGAECVVLTGTINAKVGVGDRSFQLTIPDKIWLDLDHAYAIRRREMVLDGTLQQTNNSEFVEVVSGVWLPHKSETVDFVPADAPKTLQGKPALVWNYEVVRVVVNEVADDLFDLAVKPDDRVEDFRANPQFSGQKR